MHFGMPTLLETKNLEDCAALCKDLGLAFIELNMNLPQYQTDNTDVLRLTRISKKYGIYYTVHLDENLNVCDFNKKVAQAYRDTFFQTIAVAKETGIPVINMHLPNGIYFTMPNEKVYLFNEYLDVFLASLGTFRDECENLIAHSGIKICIENTEGYDKEFLQKGLALLLESDVFALTFDIGHNWSIGGGDEAIIMQHENRIYHMHAHDAVGSKNHLALGTGELYPDKYLRLAERHNCRVVLETKTVDGLKQSVDYLKRM